MQSRFLAFLVAFAQFGGVLEQDGAACFKERDRAYSGAGLDARKCPHGSSGVNSEGFIVRVQLFRQRHDVLSAFTAQLSLPEHLEPSQQPFPDAER